MFVGFHPFADYSNTVFVPVVSKDDFLSKQVLGISFTLHVNIVIFYYLSVGCVCVDCQIFPATERRISKAIAIIVIVACY